MFEFSYSGTLTLVHPHLDPSVITRTLGLQPQSQAKAGSERYGRRGQPLDRKAVLSVWSCRLHEEVTLNSGVFPLASFIDTWLQRLSVHRDFFHQIDSEGGEVQFKVNWFSDSPCTTAVLPPNTLEETGKLGVGIELNMIVPQREAKSKSLGPGAA